MREVTLCEVLCMLCWVAVVVLYGYVHTYCFSIPSSLWMPILTLVTLYAQLKVKGTNNNAAHASQHTYNLGYTIPKPIFMGIYTITTNTILITQQRFLFLFLFVFLSAYPSAATIHEIGAICCWFVTPAHYEMLQKSVLCGSAEDANFIAQGFLPPSFSPNSSPL